MSAKLKLSKIITARNKCSNRDKFKNKSKNKQKRAITSKNIDNTIQQSKPKRIRIKSDDIDISSYVRKMMVYGAISGHGISREMLENVCRKYQDSHPRTDIRDCPMVMAWDRGMVEDRALMSLIKEYCKDDYIESPDGRTVLLVGRGAKEIVSSLRADTNKMTKLKTKYRFDTPISHIRKFRCFGGNTIGDRIASINSNSNIKE